MIPHADSIQGVLFPKSGSSLSDATDLWVVIHPGTTPDAFQRPNPNPTLRSVASGKIDGLNVSVAVQIGRVEITLNYLPTNPVDLSSGPPRIQDVSKAVNTLQTLMRRVTSAVPCVRLAMILDLGRTVAVGAEGEEFRSELPSLNLPDTSSDYLFQLNVQRKVEGEMHLTLNRLCTWSVGQVGFLMAGPQPGTPPMMMTPYIGLKIDVNTPGNTPLDPAHSDYVLEQIRSEAMLIYEYGYNRLTS